MNISQTKYCKKCNADTERSAEGRCRLCVRASVAAWKSANKDRVRIHKSAHNAAYRAANRDKAIAASAAWREKNPERARDVIKTWRSKNPESRRVERQNRRSRKIAAGGTHTVADIKHLLILQRGKCACCKSSVDKNYHVDHVIPIAIGGSNDKSNLQILCPICNLRKGAKHPQVFMQQQGFLL